jgi:hypothetical protein
MGTPSDAQKTQCPAGWGVTGCECGPSAQDCPVEPGLMSAKAVQGPWHSPHSAFGPLSSILEWTTNYSLSQHPLPRARAFYPRPSQSGYPPWSLVGVLFTGCRTAETALLGTTTILKLHAEAGQWRWLGRSDFLHVSGGSSSGMSTKPKQNCDLGWR